jgi:DNA helicase II / ATP-dependent DNA helicase PcrA
VPHHRNITVVGDDAQSIYAFRGATIRNILDFPREFPGTAVVTLEQNYRSTQPILDATNLLISRAEERYSKELFTRRTGGNGPGSSPRRTSRSRRASWWTASSNCTRRARRCARWR